MGEGRYYDLPDDPVQRVATLLNDGQERFAQFHRLIGEELRFGHDLEQYVDDRGQERRSQRVQPRDAGIYRVWRYNLGVVLKKFPIHITARPVDDQTDPELAADMKDALDWELTNPQKRYKDVRRRYIGHALAARVGTAFIDFYPSYGTYGEIFVRPGDPTKTVFADGFLDPHDPLCPWLIDWQRVPVDQARAQFKNNKIEADDGFSDVAGSASSIVTSSGNVDVVGNNGVNPSMLEGRKSLCTIVRCHYRFDYEKRKGKNMEADYRRLTPGERYMVCVGLRGQGCGYQSETQANLNMDLPARSALTCPDCGGNLKRMDAHVRDEEILMYPDGRLVIVTPSVKDQLHDDKWQVKCRSFPMLWLVSHPAPHKPFGQSECSILWTDTLAKNSLARVAYETARRSRPYFGQPRTGLEDASGEPWEFRDEQGDTFYWTGMSPPNPIQVVQGQGVNDSLFKLYEVLDQRTQRNEGTSDFQLTAEQSKNIPVGTIEQLAETGNVPIDDFGQNVYDAEGLFHGIYCDYIAATYTPARLVRTFGPDGLPRFKRLHGPSLPAVDVVVSAGPNMSQLNRETIQNYELIASMDPTKRRGFARFAKIDPEIIRQIEQDEREAREAALSMGPVPGAAPGLPVAPQIPRPALPAGDANGVPAMMGGG